MKTQDEELSEKATKEDKIHKVRTPANVLIDMECLNFNIKMGKIQDEKIIVETISQVSLSIDGSDYEVSRLGHEFVQVQLIDLVGNICELANFFY